MGFEKGLFNCSDLLFNFFFGDTLNAIEHFWCDEVFDRFERSFVYWCECCFDFFNLEFGNIVELELADFFDFFVGESKCFEDFFFRDFIHPGFDHCDSVECSGDDEVHLAVIGFFVSWIDDELAVFEADAHCGNWTFHWRAANEKGNGRSNDRSGGWIDFAIGGKDGGDDLDFVDGALWEHWTKWAVDQTRDQCSFFRWAAFAFNEAAAFDFTVGEIVFFVVDNHWEEVGAFTSFVAH